MAKRAPGRGNIRSGEIFGAAVVRRLRSSCTRRELPGPALLAVGVLSPSTRRFDLLLERDRLQQAGAASYWLIDPDGPSVIVLELRAGVYEQVARVRGDEAPDVSLRSPMHLVPSALPD